MSRSTVRMSRFSSRCSLSPGSATHTRDRGSLSLLHRDAARPELRTCPEARPWERVRAPARADEVPLPAGVSRIESPPMAEELLRVEHDGEVATVTLNRPEKRNALSIDLRVAIAEALGQLSEDDAVGCVILTGAGSAFCSGMDTTQFGG